MLYGGDKLVCISLDDVEGVTDYRIVRAGVTWLCDSVWIVHEMRGIHMIIICIMIIITQ